MNPHMMMSNGKTIDLFDPDPEAFDIEVIARSLSRLCRYTGHSKRFYSVAEHCVLVSLILPDGLKLWGLLHDAAEAFMGDMHAPLKHSPLLRGYRAAERVMEQEILKHFGITKHGWRGDLAAQVKRADDIACATEVAELMPDNGEYWKALPEPVIAPWELGLTPEAAEDRFLLRFKMLCTT